MTDATLLLMLEPKTAALLDRLASQAGLSRETFVHSLLECHAAEFDAVQLGVDAADRGELLSQQEVERWWDSRKQARRVAIAAA